MKAKQTTPRVPAALASGVALLATVLWVGGMWGVGYIAVPVLFYAQPDKMLAGMLAGHMFTLVAYVGMVCGAYLLAYCAARFGRGAVRQSPLLIVLAMLLLVLVGQFVLQPEMAALKAQALPQDVTQSPYAARFDLLHHIASSLYVAKSLLGVLLVIKSKTLLIFRAA